MHRGSECDRRLVQQSEVTARRISAYQSWQKWSHALRVSLELNVVQDGHDWSSTSTLLPSSAGAAASRGLSL